MNLLKTLRKYFTTYSEHTWIFSDFLAIVLEISEVKNWIFMIFCIFLEISIDNYSLKINFLKKEDQPLILYISCECHNISFKTLNSGKNKSDQAFDYQKIPESRLFYVQNAPASPLTIKDFDFFFFLNWKLIFFLWKKPFFCNYDAANP